MERTTIIFGIILIIIGISGYILTQMASITALIPAFFGVLFIILGRLASRENIRKHVMHGAALLALLLIIPTIGSVFELFGDEGATTGNITRSLTALAALVFLALCIKSFIDARRAKSSMT